MQHVSIALDWTINSNHIGFLMALEKGFYADLELDVDIQTPRTDNYDITPAKKVELGQVDFALCPMESILSYRTKNNPFDLIAVATLFQKDLSAISCLKTSGITEPSMLDGKVYASYKARYEDGIVREMIKNDGGNGDIKIVYPTKLGIWDTLLNNKADATWIFKNWEGLQAESEGIDLELFDLEHFGIPYSYSPVLAADRSKIEIRKEAYFNFLRATRKGFFYAQSHLEESSELLREIVPVGDRSIDFVKSIEMTTAVMGNLDTWGKMDLRSVSNFLLWLKDSKLELEDQNASDLISEELISMF